MKEETKESPKKRAMVKIDDTVAMAEKYRKLAMKDIIEKIIVNDNTLNCSILVIKQNPLGIQKIMNYKFLLNGKEYQGEFNYDTEEVNKADALMSIVVALATEIFKQNKTIFTTIL